MPTTRKKALKPAAASASSTERGYPELGSFAGNPALSLAFAGVLQTALDFIRKGLLDLNGQPAASLEAVETIVRLKQLEGATGGGIVPTASMMADAWAPGAWHKANRDAHGSMLTAYKHHAQLYGNTLVPPWFSALPLDEQTQMALNILGHAPELAPKHDDPLQHAYQMAHYNVRRAEQRLTLLHMVGLVARGARDSRMPSEQATAEFSKSMTYLWQARYAHVTKVLALGLLAGGEALETSKDMVKRIFGSRMSVMELIEVDGRLPGRYPASSEEALRLAIAAA